MNIFMIDFFEKYLLVLKKYKAKKFRKLCKGYFMYFQKAFLYNFLIHAYRVHNKDCSRGDL